MIIKTVKVSDKGQIAIPKDIRRAAKIKKKDTVLIIQEGDKILIENAINAGRVMKSTFKTVKVEAKKTKLLS
ncbi:AbrB/MazE/SpoVT family DNA-binding domain-containing protein [Candidatus Woesearchaeota archaeon CG10_big_fil_rev_8_21_14_0_10_34_8]|nr:MAG: AbrB/MazE/SpoVT family DNA-binding domain-containing protein [Candidatus Woesearchaeota archaeon CG10_big_fil_rev_8_21_14_0_10_34_8]